MLLTLGQVAVDVESQRIHEQVAHIVRGSVATQYPGRAREFVLSNGATVHYGPNLPWDGRIHALGFEK